VTVEDTTPPVLTTPEPITMFCIVEGGVLPDDPRVVDWLSTANATDTCGAVTVDPDIPGLFPEGTTTVDFEATDGVGNTTPGTSTLTATDCFCEPNPRSQGYWHRQCLGAGLINPGRQGQGRGPEEPLEADFVKVLLPDVNRRLQDRIFQFATCQDGIETEPPSDSCEKAIKQYASMYLNIESRSLQRVCEIDVTSQGCSSGSVWELLSEAADLINIGEESTCKQAARCVGAVNEGQVILESAPVAATAEPTASEPETAMTTTVISTRQASVPPVASTRLSARREERPDPPPMVLPMKPDVRSLEEAEAPAAPSEPVTPVMDGPEAVRNHMRTLAGEAATPAEREAAQEALLTALSGGYEPELRLEVARRLLRQLDDAYRSLLARHLEAIQQEAKEMGKDDLAREAAGLLGTLAPADD
jgi:hypothetical protein